MAKQKKNEEKSIIFLGWGSYALLKNKKSRAGLYWTMNEGKFWLLIIQPKSVDEYLFGTYKELAQYCRENFPDANITT